MRKLKMTNNPCNYCNGEIDEGKPLCGAVILRIMEAIENEV